MLWCGKAGSIRVLSIASEIKFPLGSIDRKTGGAFAEDAWGNVFVIHREKSARGKKESANHFLSITTAASGHYGGRRFNQPGGGNRSLNSLALLAGRPVVKKIKY